VSVRHVILGLLSQQPMSGYDIKHFLKNLDWLVGSFSFGSIYPALHALLTDSLVTVDVVYHQDRPPRKIYSITEAGRQALQEWVNQPVVPGASLKAFLMRLMLASNFSHAGLIAYLEQRRSQVKVQRAALEQVTRAQDETTDLGQHLALDYGLAVAIAELAWLDRTLERLSEQPLPMKVTQGNSTTPTA
jgi:DNA-binding PadR family transcriptional regulator